MLLVEKFFLLQNQYIKKKKKPLIFVLAFLFPPPSFLFIWLSPHSFLSGGKETKTSLSATVISIASQNKVKR